MHKGVVTCLAVLCLATVGFVQDLPSQSISNGATAVPFCHDDDSRFSALDAVADMDSLAQAIRAIHPSPDWARPAGHFETGAAAIINEVRGGAQCTGSLVYYASRMLALAADGHSRVTNAMLDSVLGRLPYRMVWRGDQLILRVLPSKDSAHLGSEVVSINRIPVRELMDRLRPIVPHNDSFEFLRYSERYLFKTRLINGLTGRPLNDPITVTVRTATGTVDFNASPIDMSSREALQPGADVAVLERQRQPPIAERDIRRYVRWEVVGDVFLLRLNAVLNQDGAPFTASIGRAFAAFDTSRANKMVVDLRGNGGGNGGFAPFVTAAIRARPVLQRPGAVLVATDKYTYSAAVTLRNDLVYRAGAISIGEPAGGWPFHPGDNVDVRLPASGIAVEISSVLHTTAFAVGDRHPALTLETSLDAAAYRRGADPLLDTVLTGIPASSPPPGALNDLAGRYVLSSAHTLELIATTDGTRALIYPTVDSWVQVTDEDRVYRLSTGMELRRDIAAVSIRLPGEPWRALTPANIQSAWELIAAGDADRGQQALIAAARTGAPGMSDAAMTFAASQVYADLIAQGRSRADALPPVRAVLLAAQAINESSPFADFALRIYQ